jgi:methylated-DNA-[protein]-cysteine S-methyltransferase
MTMPSDIPPQLRAALGRNLSDAERLTVLRGRLAANADTEGLLDITYRIVDSPHGRLLLASTEAGLVRVAFETENHDAVLKTLSETISPRLLQSSLRTETVTRQLDDYFERRLRSFNVPIDLQLVKGFRRDVIAHLNEITYGTTASYATVARIAGSPAAVRAVGSACSHNPVPIVIPCHRVVRSDGTLGQYLGGADVKASLIAMEAAVPVTK